MERIVLDKTRNVSFLTKHFEQYALDNADYVVCVSAVVKQHVDRYIDHGRSMVVPNGVDTERFDPLNFDRCRAKRDLGLENKTVLGYIGSYKAWHGLDTSIDVIGLLRKTKPHYHLLLIGTGHVYSQIQQNIDKTGLRDAVTQLAPVPHGEVPRYLAAFDYALMTYPAIKEFYFSPLKMFEYLAMGIPVVATAIGQIREVITHRQTGLLVDPPTAENFANVVAAAESDPDGLDRIGKNARRLMVERYSWQANAAQVIAACERVLAARRQTC